MSSIELWPKQQEVFDFAKDLKEVALLCEQRTGKTFITLKLVKYRIAEHEESDSEFVGVLVSLLNNKESTWLKNLREFIPEVEVFFELDAFRKHKGHRLLLIHFEALPGVIGKLVKYKKLTWAAVDEAHRLYNAGSKQSRAMARLAWVEWKLILTGTPMEKQPTDFFGQFKFLAPDVLGTNKSEFEEEWMDWKRVDMSGMKPGGPAFKEKMMLQRILKGKAKFKQERMDEFMELLQPYCIRIEKTDVGIIPPVVKPTHFDYPSSHMKKYKSMEKELWVEVSKGVEVIAPMPATRNMKLRQLASGFVYDEDQELHWMDHTKVDRAIKLFERLPKPVVIFAAFVPEVEEVHRRLEASGYDVASVYGGTPKKKRPGIWAAFQAAQLDAVVCQISAGGVGVDLWKGNHGIVTSMSYSSIIWDQAKARMDSRDKSMPANIHVLIARGTIDEDLFDLIAVKGLTTRAVLGQLKRRLSWRKKKQLPLRVKRRNST